MKSILYISSLAIASIALFCQCTPEGDDIGKLYGKWKLESFNYKDFSQPYDSVFLSFQGPHYGYQPNWKHVDWGEWSKKGNESLQLKAQKWGGDFKKIHIDVAEPKFQIDKLSNKNLILSIGDSTWVFKKFMY